MKELLYLLSLYPTKIRTRAFQQLVELGLQKVSKMQLNMDQQVQLMWCQMRLGVSPFSERTDHSSRVLNIVLDQACLGFEKLELVNHIELLKMLVR